MAIGKDIKDLYDLLVKQELTDKSFDEFKSAVENEQYRDKVYEVLVNRNLYEGEKAEFDDNYFFEYTPAATQKKKDVSDGTSPTDDTDSMSDPRDLSGSSESSLNQNEVDPRVNLDNPFASATGGLPPVPEELKQPSGVRYGANVQKGEKNTWIEEMLGKNTVTDFFGDMWRAANQGMSQGGTVDDALNIYMQGSSVSEDDLQEYIAAVEQMESMPMSDEMKSFNEIYEKNGGGILGFILGVGSNPTVVNQLLISSVASMVNPAVLAGAGSGAAAGAAIGATGFSAGPLGVLTTGGGAITGTLAGAGATLETGLSFTEFLKEEVQKKGLNFDEEGIRQTLNDEDALQRIRNKSAARGLVIGAIDGITRGAAGKIAGKSIKAAKTAGKTVTRAMKAKAALGAAGIEAIGGSTGEAAARAATGQEMDVADIGFEGITGQATSVLSIPSAVTGKTTIEMLGGEKGAKVQGQIDALKAELQLGNIVQKGINIFKPPKYGIKSKGGIVTPLTKQGILDFVSTATPSQIREMQFEIKNDPELQAIVTAKKERSQIDVMIPDFIQGEDRAKMIALETEKSNLGDTKLDVNKKREADINEQLRQITAKYDGVISESVSVTDDKGNTKKNLIVVTKDFAIEQLKKDGVANPTDQQIIEKQKALVAQAKTEKSGPTRQERLDAKPKVYGDTHKSKDLPYGDAVISDITNPDEKGVQTAQYVNPETGDLDVIISSTGDEKNFVGFTRVYENGKPTNRFTAKMESTGDAFKNMITAAEASLPPGAEVIETTSISLGGINAYKKSKVLTPKVDSDGNVVTNPTKYSNATKESVAEKGQSAYNPFVSSDQAEIDAEVAKIKAANPDVQVRVEDVETKGPKAPPLPPGVKPKPKKKNIIIDLPVYEKTGTTETATQSPAEVRNLAVDQLAANGIVNPTEQQIIQEINAIQKSSTEAVDVQESTQDGQEVGVGDPQLTQPSQQSQETQIQDGSETGIRTQTQEEISVNVAPFFETSVESTTEAGGLRKSPQYQQYKQSLIDIANDLGLEVEVDESVGGYVNEAGTKIREVSNVVKLKNATLDQASQYAAITAALAPEVQESSIAAEYTTDGAANHNGNELTIKVSDSEGTFQALKEAGIDEYTLNETNNSLTLLDIFDFSDPEADAKLDALIDILDSKNITYEITDKKAINSRFIGKESRQQILSDGRQSAIQQQQEGSSLYKKILAAINRDAQSRGISPNEYIKSDAAKQKVTADPQRVKKIAQEIKKKIESRRPKKMNPTKLRKQIFDSVIEYASQTKLAEQLNDVQFDALIRELTAEFGLKAPTRASMTKAFKLAQKKNPRLAAIDKAPNVKKKAKRVVVNEMTALKDQIRMQAKAAKQSVKAYKKFLQNITAEVKSLKKTGKISPTQSALLIDRLAKVSPFSQASVDTYLKTVDKVFTKADFVAKMQKAKSLKTKAKKNIKAGKLGVTEGDLKTAVQEVIGFNPYTIPDAQLDSYLSLMEELGASKEVLDLKQKSETLEQALEIINAVAEEVDVNDNLTLTSEKETAEDYNLDANVDIAKDIEITQEQIDNISDPNSKEVARKISKLSKQEIAELAREKKDGTMDYSAIETLKKVKQNIQNGYLPRAAMKIVQRVNANNSLKAVNKVFDTKVTKRNVVRHLKNTYKKIKSMITKRTVLDERVRSGPLFYIDDVLGNFNSKTVYDNTFGRLTKAYETFTGKTNQEVAKIEDADKILESDGVVKIRKWFGMGRSRNAVAKSKIKITLLQLQREYLSNFKDGKPNKKTPSANEFVRETLKAAKADDVIGDTQAKFIKEISEKFTGEDGQIDLNKIEKSLTKGEKKYLALIDEVNGGLGQKALFISTMHGNQVDLINNYVHHAVLSNPNKQNNVSAVEAEQKRFSESVNGKTKSITIEERTPGAKPISFNPSYSAKRGLRATNMDYYMTQTLKEVSEVVGRLKDEKIENPSAPKIQVEAAKALQNAFNEVNKNIYMNSFVEVSGGGKLLQRSIRLGYQAALSSITRAGAELVGNVLFAIQNPVTTMQALKKYGPMVINPKYNAMGHDAMVNLGSGQTSKNYDADVLNGKYGAGVQASSPVRSGGEAVNPVFNIMSQIYKFSGIGQYANLVNKIANKTLSLPDQMISRPLWFNNYTNAFAKATKAMGKEIVLTKKDFKAIAEGTSEYLSPEFAEARAEALKVADNANVVQSTSNNPYDGILKNMVSPEDSGRTKLFKTLNGFMARYSLFEFGNANHALMAMFNKGDINKAQAGAMLAGTIARMGSYMVAYTLLSQLFDDELFDAKDRYEEEDEFQDLLARQMIGSVSSLMFGTNMGNFARIPVNFALEYGINEPFLGDFRKGEYDPFIHSMVFSMINMEDIQRGDPLEVGLKIGAGPLGPAINTLRRLGVVAQRIGTSRKPETKKKYKEELEERMVVEVMGNLGLLPFYKDWRRIILKQMFGNELNAEDKKKAALYKKLNPELFKKPEEKKREPRRARRSEPQQRTQRTRRTRNRRRRD